MPQQINLCTPILLADRRYFSAQTMLQALVLLLVVGGALAGYGVWSLNQASVALRTTAAAQAQELQGLQAAMAQRKAGPSAHELALSQQLQGQRQVLLEREKLLQDLQQGMFAPGTGHAARLQLLAQSIPAQVWLTGVHANDSQLEVSGQTLEPAALNDWVSRLAQSPLLGGQRLSTVKVESARSGAALTPSPSPGLRTGTAASDPAASRPLWSFSLLSALATPAPSAAPGAPTGAKP